MVILENNVGNNPVINQSVYIVPQDPESRDILKVVDTQTRIDLETRYRIQETTEWKCNTYADVLLNSIMTHASMSLTTALRHNPDDEEFRTKCNVYNYFEIIVDNKVNKDAEKEGNINVYFEFLDSIYELVKSKQTYYDLYNKDENGNPILFGTDAIQMYAPDDKETAQALIDLENHAKAVLSRDYSCVLPKDRHYILWLSLVTFIENLFLELTRRLEESEDGFVSVNVNELMEIYASYDKNGDIKFSAPPGFYSKLNVKSDEGTESEGLDD